MPTFYRATQRCLQCHSDKTVLAADGKWFCETCKHRFAPSNAPNHAPVLMCGPCQEPTPHRLSVLGTAAGEEAYICTVCGMGRRFGSARAASAPQLAVV